MTRPRASLVAGFAAASAIAALAVACGQPQMLRKPADAAAYEGCDGTDEHGGFVPGQACRTAGTVCQSVTMYQLCTRDCRTSADCPPSPGHTPVCERFTDGSRCVVPCSVSDDGKLVGGASSQCPTGSYCRAVYRVEGSETHACL